jgi:hypothetical protein
MDEHDKDLLRHLHEHFGTEPFTARQASESVKPDGGGAPGLPKSEPEWQHALDDLLKRELVLAEVGGWRLHMAILQAASIINI